MLKLYVWFTDLLRRENGQDMIEYALIAALISIVVVGVAAAGLTGAFSGWGQRITTCIAGAFNASC